MAYQIRCLMCETDTWAGNIAELIDAHTSICGRLICAQCGGTETYVQQITGLWEREPDTAWNGYIRGVIRIASNAAAYVPYVFLTAEAADGEVSEIRFSYYKDTRPDGRLTDGLGPGKAPGLTCDELRQLLVKLGAFGVLRPKELEVVAQIIRFDAPAYSSV